MARVKSPKPLTTVKEMRPALTPEGREKQLIALAVDLVEQRLRDGTASSQETTHFLKLASQKAKLENERAAAELELMKAKTQAIKDQADMKILYKEAMDAMKVYSGHANEETEDEGYDDYDRY